MKDGWHDINREKPEDRQLVVATDGTARWMDMAFMGLPLGWDGHVATHWWPVPEFAA